MKIILFLLQIIIDPKLIHQQWPIWLHWFLLALAATYIWIRYSFKKKIAQLHNAFFGSRSVNQLLREESAGVSRFFIAISSFSTMVFSTFVFSILFAFKTTIVSAFSSKFALWLSILATVFLLVQIKLFIVRLLGFIFKKQSLSNEYIFNFTIFNQALGLYLFPIVLGVFLLTSISTYLLIYVGVALIVLVFLFRIYGSFTSSVANNIISMCYLFLYLCTLEILPLVILIKAFVDFL